VSRRRGPRSLARRLLLEESKGEATMSSINRSLAGPLLTFDIAEIAADLRREDSYVRSGRAGRTLAKSGRFRLVLVAMAEGNVIGTQQADSPMTVQIFEGDIQYRADGGEHRLRQGEILFFGPGDAHDIRANRPSLLIITISAIGDDFEPQN
jgi:quercetin dioxygenase-like cupin family protein